MPTCNWIYDFLDGHRGEYWYVCKTCGLTDWFAYYDLPEKEYKPTNCKGLEND